MKKNINRLFFLARQVPYRKRPVQQFFCYVCIRWRCKVFTEPLPSNDRGICSESLPSNERGYKYRLKNWWDGFFKYDVQMGSGATIYITKFLKNLAQPFKIWIHRQTSTQAHRENGDRICVLEGRAVDQAVSRWLPTEEARVRVWTACVVCGGQSGTGVGFLQVLWFPLPIIPPIPPSSSPGAGTISHWWPQCRVDPIGLHPQPNQLKFFKLTLIF
jgi:hypothetical protein